MQLHADPRALAVIALTVVNISVFIIASRLSFETVSLSAFKVGGSTLGVILAALIGYHTIGTLFAIITIFLAGYPWGLLCGEWHSPVKSRQKDESAGFLYGLLGFVPPLILLLVLNLGLWRFLLPYVG
jgi:hypothetical protein